MYVLGIETTCDETAAAVVKDGKTILSNVIASQVKIHQKYGGVFPEIACRFHIDKILPVIEQALQEANVSFDEIDLIAVAKGPGLMGAILIGLHVAKTLSLAWKKPLIGVNHVEAHLYAAMMPRIGEIEKFPSLGIVLSGGHTLLLKIEDFLTFQLLGTTVDDAIGEAFDKVASMLNLPYPGGPSIEKLAKSGNSDRYPFKGAKVKGKKLFFSFSGLKTKVLYTVKGDKAKKHSPLLLPEKEKKHLAASFQKAAFEDVVEKAFLAAQMIGAKEIYIGGGVSSNQALRSCFEKKFQDKNSFLFWPEKNLSLDNAAMIAGLGYQKFSFQNQNDSLDLAAQTRIPIK